MNTYLCLGGPQDGQFVTTASGLQVFHMATPREEDATMDLDRSPFANAVPTTTYVVRELSMFGRTIRVAVVAGVSQGELADLAWTHLASSLAKAGHNLRLEGRAGL